MFSRIKLQASQRLFDIEFDISIFDYNFEKQLICKKKKARLKKSRSRLAKTHVSRINKSYYSFAQILASLAMCNQYSI